MIPKTLYLILGALLLTLLPATADAQKKQLVVALNQDPDISDLEVRRATLEDTYLAMVQQQESGRGPGGVTQLQAAATSQAPEERAS